MKKKLLVLFLFMALLFIAGYAHADNLISLIVNGQQISSDVPPQIIEGRVMVPVRVISESLGTNVNYDESNQKITISWNDKMKFLLALGDYMDKYPALIQDVVALVKKYNSSSSTTQNFSQPQYVPVPQYTSVPQYVPKQSVDPVKIQAEINQINTEANNEITQIENNYQTQKSNLDSKKQEDINRMKNIMAGKGMLQSGLEQEQEQAINNYYNNLYNQLYQWRSDNLTRISNWKTQTIQQLQQQLKQ